MTQRNNILLIVKQHPGIEYNSLLTKVSSGYGSVNSARAALSRAVKDLNAMGMLVRKGNSFFVTEKGTAEINSEMKNKLLIRLNTLLKSKEPVEEINDIVEMLSTLIERSKQDNDLLKAAKGSTEFYVNDLVSLQKKLGKRIHNLEYLGGVMSQQIESIRELDFNDQIMLNLKEEAKAAIPNLLEEGGHEITAEFQNTQLLEAFAKKHDLKIQGNGVSFNHKMLSELFAFAEKNKFQKRNSVNIYLPTLRIRIDPPYVYLTGPCSRLKGIVKKAE